jgi:hypothetical protein
MSYRFWVTAAIAVTMAGALVLVWYKPAEIRYSSERAISAPGFLNGIRLAVGRMPRDLAEHQKFANHCLIVRCTDVVNAHDFADPAGKWSFKSLISAALTKNCGNGCPETPEQWLLDWVGHSRTGAFGVLQQIWMIQNPDKATLDNIPLRLLAVVDRMDLAKVSANVSDGKCHPLPPTGNPRSDALMCGAEVRFVYAGINNFDQPYLTVILEFVLPGMAKDKFQKLAAQWTVLEGSPTSSFVGDLEGSLDTILGGPGLSQVASARIRVDGTDGIWRFGQAALLGPSGQPQPVDRELDQQPNLRVTQCLSDRSLANFVNDPKTDVLHSSYSLDSIGAQAYKANIQPLTKTSHVLTFRHNLVSDQYRLAFSVNSCTGCHGFETVNPNISNKTSPFDQIKYRTEKAQSNLSNFLSGQGSGSDPTLTLWSVDKSAVYPGCLDAPPSPGKFNDLWRRHDFFDTLAKMDPRAPDQEWVDKLQGVTSVVAWQPH